jgi:hypothetical protein
MLEHPAPDNVAAADSDGADEHGHHVSGAMQSSGDAADPPPAKWSTLSYG